ncbi:phospholipase A2 [Streptomyces sp. NPDC001520]|uniref:phospholipase A2 n=1 Tax=Streptomyces sp. NPDC001520 TaxID=3364581 RepID=UPI003675892A
MTHQTDLDEFSAVPGAHLRGDAAMYEFNWDNDGCTDFPEQYLGFDFTAACVRHHFGYRNYEKAAWR